jgi:hypothetical protein
MGGMSARALLPYAVGAAVLAAIVTGLVMIGPPSAERKRRLDEIRIGDVIQLSRAIDLYWTPEGRLPLAIETLADVPDAAIRQRTLPPAADGERGDRCWAHGAGAPVS